MRVWLRTAGLLVTMLGLYFVAPFGRGDDPFALPVAIGISLVAVALLVWGIVVQAKRLLETGGDDIENPLHALILLLFLVVTVFSGVYFLLGASTPGEFDGLDTRLDSMYFTFTTLATVGYGDVHAAGQAARAIVCLQLVFDVIFVAAFAQLFISTFTRNRTERRRLAEDQRSED